ncbi:hypothetical protein FGO68_gene14116 [Halteria grandinella]|uniref:RNA helicase n=1 Tax=Halteria grandinella TaxID=5974 RepID=A0A8J8T2B8_HALGN|nr:hypothetical protein FGO68_gene14116 [Halteria grandinella]
MEDKPTADSFKTLRVDNWLCKNLQAVGITKPTWIQSDTLLHTMSGKNIIGCAQTGSGKTACFALPILQKLAVDPYGVFGLVLTPTRELAFQIMEQFKVFAGNNMNLRISVIVGGVDIMKQATELAEIPHIIIATPGRFVHHLQNDQCTLNQYLENLQFLVFDEADRMLTEDSFRPELEVILSALPKERQTLLFSATMVPDYDKLLSKELIYGTEQRGKNVIEVGNTRQADEDFQMTVQGLEQKFSLVPEKVKEAYLVYILKQAKLKKQQQCIIFTSTCKNCHFLAQLLMELELDGGVTYIHSLLSQKKRLANIARFKSSQARILVATDVASRGLDIPSVHLVLNFDVPKNPKDYVHRVGRTARAGRGGTSMTLVTQYDIKLITAVEEYVKVQLEKTVLPEKEVLDDLSHIVKVMQVVRIKMNEQGMDEQFEQFKQRKKAVREDREAKYGKQGAGEAKKRDEKAKEKAPK